MTQTEVDKIVDEYVGILDKLIENINQNLSFSAASIYEHVAAVIPQLLARLVYKCSLDMLDAVLGVVYISDKLTILHGQSDHLSRRFRSPISERDSQRSKSFL